MRTIEEIEKDRKLLDEEAEAVVQANPAPWQALVIERHGGHIDPMYPAGVRFGGSVIYCSPGFVSVHCLSSEEGIELLETIVEILRRRLAGEDI